MYRQLTQEQRCQIYALKQQNFTQELMADALKVNQSTISRELARNTGLRGYRYQQANEFARERSVKQRSVKRVMTPEIIARIEFELTQKQWSPQQISGRLWLTDGIKVSHETIYQHIWSDKKAGGILYQNLRQLGKKRNKRGSANAGRGLIPERIDISLRPKIVDEKTRLGDWEIDSIIGAKHQGSIVSMVERKTKLTMLSILSGANKIDTKNAIIKRLKPIKKFVLTITSDNGKEFADHKKISQVIDNQHYFCTPYHSWERGLNENTNGLVRQYFPKKLDFAGISQKDVQIVENLLNNRPRKTLNYFTPYEVFSSLTNNSNLYALRC